MDMDELDSALFGRPTGSKSKPTLGNLDSLFGEPKKAAKKPSVSFLAAPSEPTAASQASTKSALDDLFASTVDQASTSTPSTSALHGPRPPRQLATTSTLSSVLGPSRQEKEEKHVTAQPREDSTSRPSSQPTSDTTGSDLRAKRLESEVERLHREIEDLKVRKKDDEMDLENAWKGKMSKREREYQDEVKELEAAHQKQVSKLTEEHSSELERLKAVYERQLEVIQQSVGQWKDVNSVVDKVDSISTSLHQLTENVSTATDRAALDKEASLRIREEQIENRERRLADEKTKFEQERKMVYELNAKLNDLCRDQEKVLEQDKYRIREEWNRLSAEKMAFKEDQTYILQKLEKQKAAIEESKISFFNEQHDLLLRVTTERQLLEHEKNDFHGKRSLDVKRLKEEAGELQRRAQNLLAAEEQINILKRHYESKTRQLQELEVSLMEECLEMENLRNQLSYTQTQTVEKSSRNYNVKRQSVDLASSTVTNQDLPQRNEGVSTVLKKHSEFLERYIGQKVAAVAPRPVAVDSVRDIRSFGDVSDHSRDS